MSAVRLAIAGAGGRMGRALLEAGSLDAGTAIACRTSHALPPPRYSASSANPTGTADWPSDTSASGETDQ